MNKLSDKRIEFLYASIADAQELIRFIDTKVAFSITIIGAFIFGLFTTLDNLIKYFKYYNYWLYIELALLIILLILSICTITRIIFPSHNPSENLSMTSKKKIRVKFFLAENKYHHNFPFFNSNYHRLNYDIERYTESVKKASENDLIDSLSYELFKVSYTRNIKNDRFKYLIILLIVTTAVFVLQYLTYLSQTEHIKISLDTCSKI